MNILLWHVHGSWTTAFVQGGHMYLVPVTADRGPYGRGRARTYDWPRNAQECSPEQLRTADVDVAILQRPEELEQGSRWLRRRIGRDIPAIYLEHNTPQGDVPRTRHPMADRDDLVLVHVTGFNALFWDAGATPTRVIEHGIPEPAARYTGELSRFGVVINEPMRRGRVTGTDLLPWFAEVAPLDVFGIHVTGLAECLGLPGHRLATFEDPPQPSMHRQLSRRRAYLHLTRWTSLGLSLLEAMAMGMPVIALATTEAAAAIPPGAGVLDTRVENLIEAAHWLLHDEPAAHRLGAAAAAAARERYGLDRFLADWDRLLGEVCRRRQG